MNDCLPRTNERSKTSLRGLNRCDWCNKFCSPATLGSMYLPEPGSIALEPKTITVCADCHKRIGRVTSVA
jgi:hypothetical protein